MSEEICAKLLTVPNAVTGSLGLNDKHDAVKSVTIIEFKDGKQAYRTTVKP